MPATIARRPRGRDHRRVGAHAARGVRLLPRADGRRRGGGRRRRRRAGEGAALRDEVERVSDALGRKLKILVGKPGLDGHSNGAEQIAVRARDAGMEVVYEGIRLTPGPDRPLARSTRASHVIGLSILSGSHRELIPGVLEALREAGAGDVPVVVGGIIPEADVGPLKAAGVAAVYTPKDFDLSRIMRDIVALVAERTRRRGHGPVAASWSTYRRRARRAAARRATSARRPRSLNLVENRAPARRAGDRRAARRGLAGAARRRGARPRRGRHRAARGRQVDAAAAR